MQSSKFESVILLTILLTYPFYSNILKHFFRGLTFESGTHLKVLYLPLAKRDRHGKMSTPLHIIKIEFWIRKKHFFKGFNFLRVTHLKKVCICHWQKVICLGKMSTPLPIVKSEFWIREVICDSFEKLKTFIFSGSSSTLFGCMLVFKNLNHLFLFKYFETFF